MGRVGIEDIRSLKSKIRSLNLIQNILRTCVDFPIILAYLTLYICLWNACQFAERVHIHISLFIPGYYYTHLK